jgi:hypothetical protein
VARCCISRLIWRAKRGRSGPHESRFLHNQASMAFVSEHLWLVSTLAVLAVAIVGWRVSRVAVRSLRVFIRSLWPH